MPKQQKCPKCGNLSRPIRGGSCSRCKPKRPDPFKKINFNARVNTVIRRPQRLAIANRSSSAPPLTLCTNVTNYTPTGVTYVDDLTDMAWTGNAGCLRLAYRDMTGGGTGMEGLVIGARAATRKLRDHFDAIATFMEANRKRADATEGTGEAAAALGVVQTYPGYTMVWGFGRHAGAGIDQIWKKQTTGTTTDYLIVEAKGVNQGLSYDIFQPAQVGQQMSLAWIIDRLARMSDPIGDKVLTRCGLTAYNQWPNYNGGSKSYYGARTDPNKAKTVSLHGVVIAAVWNAGPNLGFRVTNQVTYM